MSEDKLAEQNRKMIEPGVGKQTVQGQADSKEDVMSKVAKRIDRREDVNPALGEHKYGDVEFADSTNNKYPIDTPEHVRAAWSYINHKDNAAKYDADEVALIKKRIKRAAQKQGVEISEG